MKVKLLEVVYTGMKTEVRGVTAEILVRYLRKALHIVK